MSEAKENKPNTGSGAVKPAGPGRGPMGGGPMGGMGLGEKAKDFKGTMKKLMGYLKPYFPAMLLVVLLAAGSSVFAIVGPKILGKATTKIFEGLVAKVAGTAGAGIDFVYIQNIILLLLGLYVASSVFAFIQGYIISGVAQKVSFNLRKDISEKISRLPLKYFDTRTHGDILSRVTNDVDTVSQTLNQSLSQIITSVVTIIGVLVMMFSISWLMTLAAILILPVSAALTALVIKNSQKYFRQQQAFLGEVNGHVEEIYGGHLIMKAFNGEQKAIETFDGMNDRLFHSAWKSQFLSGMMMPIMVFIGNLGFVLVSILGGWLAIRKTIEVGDILSFIQYVRQFTQPIAQIAQISNIIQSTAAASERVFEFLEEAEEVPETPAPLSPQNIEGEVAFKNVHFGYHPDKTVINDLNAVIKPGQRIAIVGPTGAGKTTIVKLLMRFYDVNSGGIYVDGHNIKDLKRNDLRSIFGMVLQDTWLFNGTIMENIRYGKLTASDDEVKMAAKAAHAHSFIKTLPHGYQMELNEEATNISQGQKQLLTIARAILADPKILILDEATSSVDTRTEVLIQKAMENLMQGRTSFIIAHRLSTIRDADLILVMNEGDIVEQGRHEELLKANGFYASLYRSQFALSEAG
jgi:ATP-binding cassette subfamily B multidrug efflux pump